MKSRMDRVAIRGSHGTSRDYLRAGPYAASITTHEARVRLPNHAHPYANITLVLAGTLMETGHRHELTANAGTLFFRAPGEVHRNSYGKEGSHSLLIDVPSQVYVASPRASTLYEECRVIRQGAPGRIAWRIAEEVKNPDGCSGLAVEGLVLELQVAALRQKPDERASGRQKFVARAIDYVHANARQCITLAALANVAGVPPTRLVRAFRRIVGATPAATQRRLRLEWAADELLRTDKSIGQIAAEAGFVDQSHLTHAFGRKFGMTPASYRKRTIVV